MEKIQDLYSKKVSLLFLVFAIVFGIFLRIYPLLHAGFPLVDGGMFFTMIKDLEANHFALPAYTTYNLAHIPYVYPPFAFYLAGLLNNLAHIPLLGIIKWQPVIINILAIPLVYLFAKRLLANESEAALATLIYVLLPNSYWWQIVGGGLTRSLGALFFLLTAYFSCRMYQEKNKTWIVFTVLAGSLTVLSHLEWALQAVAIGLLFWVSWGRDRGSVLKSIVVVSGVVLLTAPWWVTVILQHGIGTFYLASQVPTSHWLFWAPLFSLSFTSESTPVIAVLALIGGFLRLAGKKYLFVAWLLLSLVVDPRGGVSAIAFPASILAMTALCSGIAPQLIKLAPGDDQTRGWVNSLKTVTGRLFFLFLFSLLLYNAFQFSKTISSASLDGDELQAMDWVRSHTPQDANFLVLDWQETWAYSFFSEWFPALSERHSIATVQGSEWLGGDQGFTSQVERYAASRLCLFRDVGCLDDLGKTPGGEFDYVIISSRIPGALGQQSAALVSLENSGRYRMVYSNTDVNIFQSVK